MFTESLTPRPELENNQDPNRSSTIHSGFPKSELRECGDFLTLGL
jgi:hypothetical protein